MPITEDDIKLLKSQRMTDADDGGGRMTGDVIVDGESNNIFPDISELDRTYGRVNLRKVFPAVLTPDADVYYGAHMIVEQLPQDQAIDVLLYSTADWNDERTNARDHVEQYVVAGPVGPWFLYDTQVAGQRQILMFARPGASLPDVGDVIYLVEDEGDPSEYSQYIRIINVAVETRTFTDDQGEFQRDVITCELSDALRETYHGATISRYDTLSPAAKARTTLVADAARYYAAKPLAQAASIGDQEIVVSSTYGQLVPAARSEKPVVDAQVSTSVVQVTSGSETFEIAGPSHTHGIDVSLGNRAYNYVATLAPIPAPGVLRVEYRALGKWYSATDDGTGRLTGSASGTVSYETGSVVLSLQALPDVGSRILFTWGTTVHYDDWSGTLDIVPPEIEHDLGEPVVPGSLTLTWLQGGASVTATAGADGVISGSGAEGLVVHATGKMYVRLSADADSQLQIDYETDTRVTEVITGVTEAGGYAQFALSTLPVRPGSLELEWVINSKKEYSSYLVNIRSAIDGERYSSGADVTQKTRYILRKQDDGSGGLWAGSGTVDYATGEVNLEILPSVTATYYNQSGWHTAVATSTELEFTSGVVTARYIQDTGTPTTRSVTIELPPLRIQFAPISLSRIVPGTVRFRMGGVAFSDRAGGGILYWTDGTVAGSIDYDGRIATITQHNGGGVVTVDAMVAIFGDWYDDAYSFRTGGSPVQPGSLIVSATDQTGAQLIETADTNGFIASATATGYVAQDMGVAQIRFGQLVPDSSLTAEEKQEHWYDPADVDADGNIWKPRYVYPSTVRHSEVVYSYLPLDADVLGLDPVRLPSDGRVPIYRPGDVVVVHHTQETVVDPISDDQVIDLGRGRIARLRIEDANGDAMAAADYTADLDAGTVTLVNTAPYTAPLAIRDTIADMVMVSDARIDGGLTLTHALTHDFPANETIVSSALIIGDRWARYDNLFDQQSWTGAWDDSPIGSPAAGTYDDINHPIILTNDGAIEERWYCRFLNTTEVEIFGEHVGGLTIAGENRWSIANDISPVNPATGAPYFTLSASGWGAGWATGNVLRFNTHGANYPVWIARSIQQSSPGGDDRFCVQIRGDIDA